MKKLKGVAIFVLGFLAYPGLFVPLMLKFASEDAIETWLVMFAEYLRIWGF